MSGEHWPWPITARSQGWGQKAWVPPCTWLWDTFKHGGFYPSRIQPRISRQLCWLGKAPSFTWHTAFTEPPATGLITWIRIPISGTGGIDHHPISNGLAGDSEDLWIGGYHPPPYPFSKADLYEVGLNQQSWSHHDYAWSVTMNFSRFLGYNNRQEPAGAGPGGGWNVVGGTRLSVCGHRLW